MVTFISRRSEDTRALGEDWGRAATAGWVIALTGELGAGKTQLVKGLALGLGSTARVHSPTFTLLSEYRDGRLPLFHLDLYRLETPDQIVGAGLEPYLFAPAGVTVVEWAERWWRGDTSAPPAAYGRFRRVAFEVLSETQRRITYDDSGA